MNNAKRTLIILTPGFPQSEDDSTCLPLQQALVKTINQYDPGLDIIVLAFQYPYSRKQYIWYGNRVISFNGQNKGGIARLWLRVSIMASLLRIHRSVNVIGVLSFWYGECALIGKRFCDRHQLKHYCWILGQDAKRNNRYPRKLGAGAAELIALSDFLQEEFEKNHAVRPLHLIPPGVIATSKVVGRNRDIDVLGVGSLIALKRFDVFLELVAKVKKDLPGIKVVLVGDGPAKEQLLHLISKYKLEDNCRLIGEVKHEEVLTLMSRSKVLLHPSAYEGFSGVCQEALCNGAHVISFCRAMNEEIPQWHIVGSEAAMQEKLLSILQDRMTEYINIDTYPIDATARKLLQLFRG